MVKLKLVLSLLAALYFAPNTVLAVERCIAATPKAEFARADAVFSGEVVAQESRKAELQIADDQKKTKVLITATEFKVNNFWKGGGEKKLFLIDYQYGDKSDSRFYYKRNFSFDINKIYLVYGYEFQNALQAHARCSRTRFFDSAADDLKEIGAGDTPTKAVDKTLSEVLTEFINEWNN